ncbi:MAG: transglycosylase SLT domain-containing protein [Candidatus Eisenbacteria bacterium]
MRFRRGDRSTSRPVETQSLRLLRRRVSAVRFFALFVLFTMVASAATVSSALPAESGLRTLDGVTFGTEEFPCPPELRPRTEFWLRIFTEFERTQKVLHDQRYPWIIYEVIDVAGMEPDSASATEKGRIAFYKAQLDAMGSLAPSDFSAAQHRIATLLRDVPEEAKYTRAKERLRTQSGIRENVRAGLVRSGRYMAFIHQTMAEHGVPAEVAFLPHVESSFNPKAQSHAGASGLWQFTKGTAKLFMKVEGDIDERMDPYAASEAAARYLLNSYEKLGSWPLAVVSYNHGLAGVRRAMEALGTDDIARVLNEYDGPRFGFASQNFYCELLAAIEVGRNPQRYFGDIEIEPPAMPIEFELDHYVSFNALCMGFAIPRDEMSAWNPALGRSYVEGERHVPKGYTLRLPAATTDPGALYASIPSYELHAKAPRPHGHQVVAGDTLAKIAQRYRVSLADLRGMNGLEKSDRIYPGQVLALP